MLALKNQDIACFMPNVNECNILCQMSAHTFLKAVFYVKCLQRKVLISEHHMVGEMNRKRGEFFDSLFYTSFNVNKFFCFFVFFVVL